MVDCGLKKGDRVVMGGSIATVTGVGVRYNRRGDALPVVVVECADYTTLPMRIVGQDINRLFPASDLNIAY